MLAVALVQPALVGEGREAGVLHDGAQTRQLVVDQQNLKQGGECEYNNTTARKLSFWGQLILQLIKWLS